MNRFCCCFYVRTGAKVIIILDLLGFLVILWLIVMFLFYGAVFNFT